MVYFCVHKNYLDKILENIKDFMMEENFDKWNQIKQKTQNMEETIFFKERDIFWAKLGKNIGFEQDGKGEEFTRPVIIIKKYTPNMVLVVPLSRTLRDGSFFFQFQFKEKISTALLVQNRMLSSKRLVKKIGKIDELNFKILKEKLINLIK